MNWCLGTTAQQGCSFATAAQVQHVQRMHMTANLQFNAGQHRLNGMDPIPGGPLDLSETSGDAFTRSTCVGQFPLSERLGNIKSGET
jgi:hypothetical protein